MKKGFIFKIDTNIGLSVYSKNGFDSIYRFKVRPKLLRKQIPLNRYTSQITKPFIIPVTAFIAIIPFAKRI